MPATKSSISGKYSRMRSAVRRRAVTATDQSKLSFKTPHIRDECLALRCVQHEDIEEPRTAFVRSCAILYSDFEMIAFFGIKAADGGHIFARSERGATRAKMGAFDDAS